MKRGIVDSVRFTIVRVEIVRDQDRCGFDDPASRHCWSPYGAAGIDAFRDAGNAVERADGDELFALAIANADRLCVQGAKWNGLAYGFGVRTVRKITSGHMHTDHVHLEVNDDGAANLAYDDVMASFDPVVEPPTTKEHDVASAESTHWHGKTADRPPCAWADFGSRTIRLENNSSLKDDQPVDGDSRAFTIPAAVSPGTSIVRLRAMDAMSPPQMRVWMSGGPVLHFQINKT
jgi:3',5'-cyclic AMP phosphodiesterase CpdA